MQFLTNVEKHVKNAEKSIIKAFFYYLCIFFRIIDLLKPR